jgi:hypothetical protein
MFKTMQDAVDLDGVDGGALKRRQQHAAQRITQRHAEAALQGFSNHRCNAVLISARRDLEFARLNEILPVFLQHVYQGRPRSQELEFWMRRTIPPSTHMSIGCLSVSYRRFGVAPEPLMVRAPLEIRRGGACVGGNHYVEWW